MRELLVEVQAQAHTQPTYRAIAMEKAPVPFARVSPPAYKRLFMVTSHA